MAHGVAKIHILYTPTVAFKFMHNYPMKILVVYCIVRAKSGGIIVIDDTVIGMGRIVGAEVCNKRRDFALKFYVERFEHIKAVAARLTAHNPVDIGIVVHANTKLKVGINAAI